MPPTFEEQVKQDFKTMEKYFEDFEKKFEVKVVSIDGKLTQVVDALLGNPLTKEGGLISDHKSLKLELEILKKKVEAQESFKNKILWFISVIVVLALVLKYIVDMYKIMIK